MRLILSLIQRLLSLLPLGLGRVHAPASATDIAATVAVVPEAERGPGEIVAAAGDLEAEIVGGQGVGIERDQGVRIATDRGAVRESQEIGIERDQGAVIERDRGAVRDSRGAMIKGGRETLSTRSSLGAVIMTGTEKAGGIVRGAGDVRGKRVT